MKGEYGTIVRGSRWPMGNVPKTVRLTRASPWTGAEGWDWDLYISRRMAGGTPDLKLDADVAPVLEPDPDSGLPSVLLTFHATSTETSVLEGTGKAPPYFAMVVSDDGTDDDPSYWWQSLGKVEVIDPVGQA